MHEQASQQSNNFIALQDFLAELGRDELATANLVGYFDVLIEMDLELKERERNNENERNNRIKEPN